ncbi:MAG: hypothetical protein KOO65_05300 [Desulfobacterales bacterium]|nr:hypothetical protein [Desulfobacterales bacterium]
MNDTDRIESMDKLTEAAGKLSCLTDLFSSTDATTLFLTDNGLTGLTMLFHNIREDIEKAEQLIGRTS